MSPADLGLRVAQPVEHHQLPATSQSPFAAKNLLWDHYAYIFAILPRRSPVKDRDRALEKGRRGCMALAPWNRTRYLGSTNWLWALRVWSFILTLTQALHSQFHTGWKQAPDCMKAKTRAREFLPLAWTATTAAGRKYYNTWESGRWLHSFWGNILYCPRK